MKVTLKEIIEAVTALITAIWTIWQLFGKKSE